MIEKVKNLQTFLDSTEITAIKDDMDFSNVIKETKDFLTSTGNDQIIKSLPEEKKEKYYKVITNIDDNLKSYVATKNNQYCLLINHFICDGYNIFFSEIKEFEKFFIDSLNISEKKLAKLNADLIAKVKDFNIAISSLEIAEEKCKKSSEQVDKLIIEAKNRVNTFSDKMTKENNERIEAKRKQIDNDMGTYRKGVEETFNTWVEKFKELEKSRVEFLNMYEVGIKYSKDARFDEYSLKERITADIFRWISLGLMILVVFAIGFITYQTTIKIEKQELSISILSIISRFLLVFSLMIPAVYSSRESSRHRRNSDKYTQMANELRAFEIAIRTENMKEETRDRIKEEIFKRYFGNIFANTSMDRNISEDLIEVSKVLKTEEMDK
jgi:hypothetical protein